MNSSPFAATRSAIGSSLCERPTSRRPLRSASRARSPAAGPEWGAARGKRRTAITPSSRIVAWSARALALPTRPASPPSCAPAAEARNCTRVTPVIARSRSRPATWEIIASREGLANAWIVPQQSA